MNINDLRDDYIKTTLFNRLGGGFIFMVPIVLGIFLTPFIFHLPAVLASMLLSFWISLKNHKAGVILSVLFLLAAIFYTVFGIYTILKPDILKGILRTVIGLLEIMATGITAGSIIKDKPVV